MLLSGPAMVGITTKVTVALLKAGRLPIEQLTVLVPSQLPWLGVVETRFTPAGKVSPMVTPDAKLGLLLDMVMM